MIRVGVLDGHPAATIGLKHILESELSLSLDFIGDTASFLFAYLDANCLDVLVLDIKLADYSGFDVLTVIKRKYAKTKVLMLTSHEDSMTISRAFCLGASGYLSKGSSVAEIIDGVYAVSKGEEYVDKKFRKDWNTIKSAYMEQAPITKREENVLRLVCKGYSTKEIADIMYLSVFTVNNHRKSILQKTGAENIVKLIKYSFHYGYLD